MTFGTSKLLASIVLAAIIQSLGAASPTGAANPLCRGRAPTIVGSAEGGRLVGTPGPDVIAGRAGDDRIHGLGGNDRICGGRGNDVLLAGPGRDLVDGGVGDDRGNAGGGDDRFLGGPGADSLWGDAFDASGNDVLLGGGGSDLFNPRDGQDLIRGGTGRDGVAYWEADGIRVNLRTGVARGWGRDRIHSVELVVGSLLDDIIIGDEGPELLEGGFGDDLLVGGAGRDRLLGDAGDDTLDGGTGDDELVGNDGIDRVDYGTSGGPVTADLATGEATGDGSDILVGVEHLVGSPYDDSLTGDSNANEISGGEGNDMMLGEKGRRLPPGRCWRRLLGRRTRCGHSRWRCR